MRMSGRWVYSKHGHTEALTLTQGNYTIGDPILHIELRRWADIVLIAPCSANTLSKIAHGLCDNLAVCFCIPPQRVQPLIRMRTDLSSACSSSDHSNICISSYEHANVRASTNVWTYSDSARRGALQSCWSNRKKPRMRWHRFVQILCVATLYHSEHLLKSPGLGAMTEWRDIVKVVVDQFRLTREPNV